MHGFLIGCLVVCVCIVMRVRECNEERITCYGWWSCNLNNKTAFIPLTKYMFYLKYA